MRGKLFLPLAASAFMMAALGAVPAEGAVQLRKIAAARPKPAPVVKPTPSKKKIVRRPAAPAVKRPVQRRRARIVPVARVIAAPIVQPDFGAMPQMVPPLPDLAAAELHDSFFAARTGRRVHQAIDIMRPEGTPMVACVDGFIEKLHTSALGGVAIYLTDAERRYRFYYAHLSAYAEGLAEGMPVVRGTLIGYVGSTGNASATAPHLHFQVMHGGGVVNPFPVLRSLVDNVIAAEPLQFIAPATDTSSESSDRRNN